MTTRPQHGGASSAEPFRFLPPAPEFGYTLPYPEGTSLYMILLGHTGSDADPIANPGSFETQPPFKQGGRSLINEIGRKEKSPEAYLIERE